MSEDCLKLTIYSSEQARREGSPLRVPLVRALAAQRVRDTLRLGNPRH